MTIDLDKIKSALEWVLEKATWVTGAFVAIGCLHMLVAHIVKLPWFGLPEATHGTLNEVGKWGLYTWVALALITIIVEIRKNRKQAAQVAAEQIRKNPALPDASVVPAVQKEIVSQIVNGEEGAK